MASSGNGSAATGVDYKFDEEKQYYPLFCLSREVPLGYFELLQALTNPDDPWLEVTASDPYSESILASSRSYHEKRFSQNAPNRPASSPFEQWTPKALFDFNSEHLQPIQGKFQPQFTRYIFLAVDDACFKSLAMEDYKIMVLTDAADFNEMSRGEEDRRLRVFPKLKVFRLKIEAVMNDLSSLEMNITCPSEVAQEVEMKVSVFPPPMLVPVGSSDNRTTRERKWAAIEGLPVPEGENPVDVFDL